MNDAKFKENKIVRVQGRDFPIVGGRLRIAHEIHQGKLSIVTELVDYRIDQHAVVRADVGTDGGRFTATGTATAARDPKLTDSLLELAETRAVARALRFAGIGVETCAFEELGEGEVLGGDRARGENRTSVQGSNDGSRNGRRRPTLASSAQKRAIESLARRLGRDVTAVLHGILPGTDLETLTLIEASSIIDLLKSKAGNGHGNGHAAEERR